MIGYESKEEDWKVFRKNVPIWQTRSISSLIEEYKELLSRDERSVQIFWTIKEKVDEDSKKNGVVIEYRRTTMVNEVLHLLSENAITIEDLDEFSDELKSSVQSMIDDLD